MGLLSKIFGSNDQEAKPSSDYVDNNGAGWNLTKTNLANRFRLTPHNHNNSGGTVSIVVGNEIKKVNASTVVFDEQGQAVSYSEVDGIQPHAYPY